MTSSDQPPPGNQSDDDIRSEVKRLEDEHNELRRQAHELRLELSDEGPMDANDRAAILTQAEELESFAVELDARRESLRDRLGGSG
jgi:hypothetical protein